jgi:hypothetical protein
MLRVLRVYGLEWRCRWSEGHTNARADAVSRAQVKEFLLDSTGEPISNGVQTPWVATEDANY